MLTLLYDGHELGTIEVSEKDFPTTVGVFTPKDNWRDFLDRPALNFVRLSYREITEDEFPNDEFEEVLAWITSSEKWGIRKENGMTENILVPTIRHDFIAWR